MHPAQCRRRLLVLRRWAHRARRTRHRCRRPSVRRLRCRRPGRRTRRRRRRGSCRGCRCRVHRHRRLRSRRPRQLRAPDRNGRQRRHWSRCTRPRSRRGRRRGEWVAWASPRGLTVRSDANSPAQSKLCFGHRHVSVGAPLSGSHASNSLSSRQRGRELDPRVPVRSPGSRSRTPRKTGSCPPGSADTAPHRSHPGRRDARRGAETRSGPVDHGHAGTPGSRLNPRGDRRSPVADRSRCRNGRCSRSAGRGPDRRHTPQHSRRNRRIPRPRSGRSRNRGLRPARPP